MESANGKSALSTPSLILPDFNGNLIIFDNLLFPHVKGGREREREREREGKEQIKNKRVLRVLAFAMREFILSP